MTLGGRRPASIWYSSMLVWAGSVTLRSAAPAARAHFLTAFDQERVSLDSLSVEIARKLDGGMLE